MEILALLTPSTNRVYGHAAVQLAQEELRFVADQTCPGALVETALVEEAGTQYIRLTVADEAWEDSASGVDFRRMLAYSPHIFAAYEIAGSMPAPIGAPDLEDPDARHELDELPDLPLLLPIRLLHIARHGSELVTTLKYTGKTNDQFTALMVHLAAAAARTPRSLEDGSLRLLDPVAGRGTTLNLALMWGLSPVGIDIDKKDAELYRAFLTAWLRERRLRHHADSSKLTSHGTALGHQFQAEFAESKVALKSGPSQRVTLYTADTATIGDLLKARSMDAIVGDLPYGVQHGARTGATLARSPLDLLEGALASWTRTLAVGGALVLAVNRHTTPVDEVSGLLTKGGYEVLSMDGQFRHRVDASIDRDIVIARKL